MFLRKVIDLANIKTYAIGLDQAKAYRILKHVTSQALEKYSLSPLDWALLGLLSDQKNGLRPSEIAELLGVEAPFVTVIVDELQTKKMVVRKKDAVDRRAKLVTLTAHGHRRVLLIENQLRQATKGLMKGVSPQEIIAYMKVLKAIIANG